MGKLLVCFIIFFGNASYICGQTASEVRDSQQLFQEAKLHLENSEFAAFENKTKEAANLRPKHPTLMLNHAYALCKLSKFDQAIEKLAEIARMGVYVNISGIEEFNQLGEREGYEEVFSTFQKNLRPVGNANIALEATDPNLLVEGVSFDRQSRSFFLTSVHEKKVIKYNGDGEKLSALQLTLSPLGIRMDPDGEHIWASMAGIEQGKKISVNQIGQSGIAKLDPETNEVVEEYIFDGDSTAHLFGDLLLSQEELIYLTDSQGGLIYQFDKNKNELRPITAKGDLISPQGLVYTADGSKLIVADYSMGLAKVDSRTGAVAAIENSTSTTLLGVDGLYRYKNALIAVQNGVRPYRILKLELNPDESAVTHAEVLLANNPALDDPTLGLVVDSTFYFNANSQWYKFSSGYNPEKEGKRTNPKILSIKLE